MMAAVVMGGTLVMPRRPTRRSVPSFRAATAALRACVQIDELLALVGRAGAPGTAAAR